MTGARRGTNGRGESGVALVEFAIVFPVLVMLVLGLLTGGITLNRKIAITNGVREGSRFAATLAVTSAPCSTAPATMTCWLQEVARITQQASEGELLGSASTTIVCVAFVHPNGSTATDQNSRILRTGGVDGPVSTGSAATCFDDGRADDEVRVQVTGQRVGKIEYLLGSSNPKLTSRSVARFEAKS